MLATAAAARRAALAPDFGRRALLYDDEHGSPQGRRALRSGRDPGVHVERVIRGKTGRSPTGHRAAGPGTCIEECRVWADTLARALASPRGLFTGQSQRPAAIGHLGVSVLEATRTVRVPPGATLQIGIGREPTTTPRRRARFLA